MPACRLKLVTACAIGGASPTLRRSWRIQSRRIHRAYCMTHPSVRFVSDKERLPPHAFLPQLAVIPILEVRGAYSAGASVICTTVRIDYSQRCESNNRENLP